MNEVRIKDTSISRNIDHYLEELKHEQAAREKRDAEYATSHTNERTGNEAMNLGDIEGFREQDEEEDWEEEYVMLDLDDVFHGAPVPNFAYTLSGLDTLNPTLTLDNGSKLIGHYMETIGTVVVYSEKDSSDSSHLQSELDNAVENTEKKPRKRIRGVCKLERKLKFCATSIESAPDRIGMPVGDDVSFMKTTETQDASLGNTTQIQNAMSMEESASLDEARPTEGKILLENNTIFTEDLSLGHDILMENASVEHAKLTEEALLFESTREMEDVSVENAMPNEDVLVENAVPTEENASLDEARPTEGETLLESNTILTEEVLLGDAMSVENASVEHAKVAEEALPFESTREMEDVSVEKAVPNEEDASLGNAVLTEDINSSE